MEISRHQKFEYGLLLLGPANRSWVRGYMLTCIQLGEQRVPTAFIFTIGCHTLYLMCIQAHSAPEQVHIQHSFAVLSNCIRSGRRSNLLHFDALGRGLVPRTRLQALMTGLIKSEASRGRGIHTCLLAVNRLVMCASLMPGSPPCRLRTLLV